MKKQANSDFASKLHNLIRISVLCQKPCLVGRICHIFSILKQ